IDGDGDMDILGANYYSYITWWENINGSGTSWNEHTIDGDFNGAHCVYSEDIDGDGDMDVLGAAVYADDITWWENINGSGTSWVEHTVDGDFDGARSVYSEDIDGDGDMDILGAAENAGDITWWENIDGSGTSWTEHTIDGDFNGTYSVYSEDIDSDGNMDVLGAGDYNNITWWNLTALSEGSLESSILDTQGNPCWDYLDWNSQTPPETSISFQVRASDDHTAMGAWSDTLTSPCQLASILNDGDRYVQYRTILETSSPDSTPTLNDVTITWDPLGIGETVESIPTGTNLFPIAPNPSAGSPIIRFGLLVPASVEICIFDLSGRLVSEIHGDEYSAGFHSELIDDLFQGIYFCRMTSGDFTATQRFVVIE
ncbi:MAG: T9SS type A sorting domain-containing protein, partial [Candidatus Aegiribacteria sp.]|nr:T9SS type A sorting domain-containing protein [Candidatus Aegiribacteria sp.]